MKENILQKIFDYKQEELDQYKREHKLADVVAKCKDLPKPQDFLAPFLKQDKKFKIIAEVKHKSPSKGILRDPFDPVAVASEYEANGAACLSVLTDEYFFGGHLDHLRAVSQAVNLPIIRKDFIWDPYQIYVAREAGASAILLIAAMLSKMQIEDLQGLAEELHLNALIELYDPNELAKTKSAKLLGVNNRDLKTFKVDINQTLQVLALKPAGVPLISESGLSTHQQLAELNAKGVAGFLIGESLIVQASPGKALADLFDPTH